MITMPPPAARKPGSVKDMSKDRADSKKNVSQQRAKLAEDWAKKNLAAFLKGEKVFEDKGELVTKLKALRDKFKEDEEKRKKIDEQTEEILKLLEKIAKDMAKQEKSISTVADTKTVGAMPKVSPPGAADIAAVLAWILLWRAWLATVRKAFKSSR
jgi:seryl-tRNA synthetase